MELCDIDLIKLFEFCHGDAFPVDKINPDYDIQIWCFTMIIALILLNNIERDEAFFKHGFQAGFRFFPTETSFETTLI